MAEDADSSSSDAESESDHETIDEKMKRITKLGKEGNIDELVKEAKIADCSPEMIAFASAKSKDLGNAAFQKKEYEQALEFYAGALVGDVAEKEKIYSNRSACLFQIGKYTDALVEATKAIKQNRQWSKGYFRAGRAALEMEFYQEALDMFQKGLDKEPSNKDLIAWSEKARNLRNQQQHDKLVKKHATDYSKFDALTKQQQEDEEQEAMANDPNRVILGDRYYSSSKMEQRQLKAMLGYVEPPPPPFEPVFDMDLVYRHDARGNKTQHPVWDPSTREWKMDAKPAPSRVDYSDSQQAQAVALFLERQTDVQYAEEVLKLVDAMACPIDAFQRGVRDVIKRIVVAPDGECEDHAAINEDARWLFVGIGCGIPLFTCLRYLPTAQVSANTAHRAFFIADLALAAAAANGVRKNQVKWIHRPSHDLAIVDPDGEDINNLTSKVDVVVLDYELFDPGLIGKGVLAKVNHIKKKLVTTDHIIMPEGATVLCAPSEVICPRGEGVDGLDWRVADETRWGAFYEVANLDDRALHEPWRSIGPVQEVFQFDFSGCEVKLSGQTDLRFVATSDGIFNCVVFWYRMNVTSEVRLDHTPGALAGQSSNNEDSSGYNRHALQWLSAPVAVSKGDEIHVRASYSRSRIRFEVLTPEVPKIDRTVSCPRWLLLRLQEEERLDAYRKAIEKAVTKVMQKRELIPILDRPPLRIVHLGAGMAQLPMISAKCARDHGIDDKTVETHGYTVVALERMPKVAKLARKCIQDNGLEQDVFVCTEDVRKLPSQPQRAQLIVAELIDAGLLGEGILVLLNAARVKMCNAFEHEVVPSRGTIWAAAFEFGTNLKNCHGFDLSVLNHYRSGLMVDLDAAMANGTARQLSNVFEVLKFDFEQNIMPSSHTVKFTPIDDGKITAFVFWYEVHMDREGDIILTNWPESVPPADFAMLEKDVHRISPVRQAICYFQGDYMKEVAKGEELEIDIGYSEAWPQFVWPGTEMVQKESGQRIPKPPPMPRHQLHFEKLKHETEDLEKKMQQGLMFDEDMLADGYAVAERIALEPNGNPNYLIDPQNANYFHMMFFV